MKARKAIKARKAKKAMKSHESKKKKKEPEEPWKGNKLFHRVQYAAVSPQPIHPLSPPTAQPTHRSPSITSAPPSPCLHHCICP